MIDIVLALLAGVLTVAAPCILPMLPILFGTSVGQTSRARPIFIAAGFTFAFAGTALLFSAFSHALGLSQDTLRDIAIVLLMAFGLLMVWPRPFELLTAKLGGILNRANAIGNRAGTGNAGGFVLGTTLGILWTPCAGPVLGSILTLIATAQDLTRAAVLLACYALGAAVPMLGIAYGGQYLSTRARRIVPYAHRLQQVFGVVTILIAVAMYYQYDALITVWLSDFYPNAQLGL